MANISRPYEVTELDVAEKTFYGFKVDKDTGRLTLDIVNNAHPGVIELPADDILKDDQYKTWLWTKNTLQFEWSDTQKTHLKMEIQ
jgi:hypothetical protein